MEVTFGILMEDRSSVARTEEQTGDTRTTDVVATGDTADTLPCVAGILASAGLITVAIRKRRKDQETAKN